MADILVVDDEENLTYSIKLTLERAGHACRVAATVAAGVEQCARAVPDLALVDVHLPDGNGLDLIAKMQEGGADVPVIVITSYGSIDSAVAAMQRGAINYIQKPLVLEELKLAVERCLEDREIRQDLAAYREVVHRESESIQIIGRSPAMREVISVADKITKVPPGSDGGLATTLLLGETGTGKEVFARYIHAHSAQCDRPFVHVSCTAIPENLFEAELFGYERGTFTDAKTDKKGLLEVAHGGTLFLDEIGDMSPATQSKLLVAIESGRFRRLGGTTERVSHARLMAATNSNLEEKIARGEFRPDLYFRLKVFCIELPPLRERDDDVFLLTDFFLERFCRKFHKRIPALSAECREAMKRYDWPGNVRELTNVLQRVVLLNDSDTLTPEALGLDAGHELHRAGTSSSLQFDFSAGDCTLASVEKQLMLQALEATRGNISEAARLVGLSRGGFRHRLEKLGLDPREVT